MGKEELIENAEEPIEPEQQSEMDEKKEEVKPIDLKQLAMDLYENKIFTDMHLGDQGHMLGMVFMPIVLGAFSDLSKEEVEERVGMIYEYYDKAGPRGINGFPCFVSFRILSPQQKVKMLEFYEQYKKLKEAFSNME